MKYEQLKAYFSRSGNGQSQGIFEYVEKFVSLIDIKLIYAKDFFKPNVDSAELFVFTDKVIWCFKNHEDGVIETNVIKEFKIEKIKLIENLKDRSFHTKLHIIFASGEELLFDANEDTGEEWKYEYSGYIRELFELLI